MATKPDGLPASPKTRTFDANKLNSLPREHVESKAKLTTSETLIVVPGNFLPKKGKRLCAGYTVGKAIGAGLQACVLLLLLCTQQWYLLPFDSANQSSSKMK